jgi:hypothetical protein
MVVTQTVDIPASHRLTVDVPGEVPAGKAIITFTPVADTASGNEVGRQLVGDECPICAAHRDPVTGEELFNAKTAAAIEEGRAMMRGEIPSKLYDSLEEMLVDLDSDD